MRRHLGWIIPLATIPAIYAAGVWGISAIYVPNSGSRSLLLLVVALVCIAGMVTCAFLLIAGARRTWRSWRTRTGKFTAVQQAAIRRQDAASEAWERARALLRTLAGGRLPPPITVWGVTPLEGETFFLDLTLDYARYYGHVVHREQRSGFYFGSPAFVLGGLAASAMANSADRRAADAAARVDWRDLQPSQVLVSNIRLVCLANGQWYSFHYSAISALYPLVAEWTVVMEFENAVPLRLSGHDAPSVATIVVLVKHGPTALSAHPDLAPLR